MPHLSVLKDLVQLGAGVLICTRATITVVAIAAFDSEPEEDALLGRLSTFAKYAGVRAREASFVFLPKWWSAREEREKRKATYQN